jgi:hypothetical protein
MRASRGRPVATWRLVTPPPGAGAGGAIAMIHIRGDTEAAMRALRLRPVIVGAVALRGLGGIDTGVIARPSGSCLLVMPHAGPAVLRELATWLDAAGLASEQAVDPTGLFPEAESEIEARMLRALSIAESPLAIDLLLDQPRRWREMPHPDADIEARSRVLSRLIEPPLVVALGPPNIGKSTLLNALAGRTAAIVADAPGTTRDHVGVRLDLAGLVVDYIDTPGMTGSPADPIQAAAQRIALVAAARADLVLVCADATAELREDLVVPRPALVIGLRRDLGPPRRRCDLEVSACTGTGLAPLVAAIRDALVPPATLDDPRPWQFW